MNWLIAFIAIAAVAVFCLGLYIAIVKAGPARIMLDLVQIAVGHFGPKIAAQVARDMADPAIDRRNKEAARVPAGPIPRGTGVTTGKVIKQPAATRRNRPKP
jgi:4-hydroxybenzoate polyprenyltransferase